ncbi:hypothetical protein DdX_09966 [Ditylenchus destructor]|uniref:Uncharacterized protein n=1 Tax=Ditylenchus destructor TaxID=166010 RepID=A0AAD4N1S1_9BILA|nr:hypothetical protein DdX_09966 [Ditylenchus destructor]
MAEQRCFSPSYRLYFLLSVGAFYLLILLFTIFGVCVYLNGNRAAKSLPGKTGKKVVNNEAKATEKDKMVQN